jgi:PKD repeat protein
MNQFKALFMIIIMLISGIFIAPIFMGVVEEPEVQETVDVTTEPISEDISENDGPAVADDSTVLPEAQVRGASSVPDSRAVEHQPEDFPEANVFYMISESVDTMASGRYLDGIPLRSDGRDTKINKADLHLPHDDAEPPDGFDVGHRMYFRFPRSEGQRFDANFNDSFAWDPFINITFNTLYTAGKEVNIEVLIDADGDFDTDSPNMADIEGVIRFPMYKTQKPAPSWDVQMEETYQINGSWADEANIPTQIRDGAIYISFWRTDNIFDYTFPFLPDLLIYCGFINKTSWLALPYEHTVALPHANVSYDFVKDNNNAWYGIWEPPSKGMEYDEVPESMKMKPYDTITFNASRSYDPNDDYNENKNIDDGVPPGELAMDDEMDSLQYKFYFGDGTFTNWQDSPMAVHKYVMDAAVRERNYTVKVQVRNRAFHVVEDTCSIRIFNEEHPPEIKSLTIMPQSINPLFPDDPKGPRAVENQMMQFSAYAIDKDPWDLNDIRYEWDLNNDNVIDDDEKGQTVTNSYSTTGNYPITLYVYDGQPGNASTLMDTETAQIYISTNKAPVAEIIAAKSGEKPVEERITAQYNQAIIFNTSRCKDPDNLPGFDVSSPKDFVQDHNLSYIWHWNLDREAELLAAQLDPYSEPDVISDPTFNKTTSHYYTVDDILPGSNYEIRVMLEVTDGHTTVNSEEYIVYLNIPPKADFYINNKTELTPLPKQPGVGEEVNFDASLSYDPNDDLNNDGIIGAGETDSLTYKWSFDDGTSAEGKVVTHAFAEIGDHTITLAVSDGALTAYKTRHLIILEGNLPPVPVLSISPLSAPTHYAISFKSSDSYDPDANDDVVKWKWSFGDGYESSEADTSHSYDREGIYKVVLTVWDRRNAESINDNYSIYIYNREPYVIINLKSEGYIDIDVKMSATADDPDGVVTGYYWDFGDGNEQDWSNDSNPTHIYSKTGTYTVTVTVKDDSGKTNISSDVIKIGLPPVPDETTDEDGVFGAESGDVLFWLIIIIVVVVIVVAIVVIVWRIRREAL